MATFSIEGEEILQKTVGDGGDSGRIYVPKSWMGETVKIVRLSRSNNEKEEGVKGVQGETGEQEETIA